MENLHYEIETLYIDGFSPSRIAKILECNPSIVYDWLEENGLFYNVNYQKVDEDLTNTYG